MKKDKICFVNIKSKFVTIKPGFYFVKFLVHRLTARLYFSGNRTDEKLVLSICFNFYFTCPGAGKYSKMFDPMFVRRNWKK